MTKCKHSGGQLICNNVEGRKEGRRDELMHVAWKEWVDDVSVYKRGGREQCPNEAIRAMGQLFEAYLLLLLL